MKFVSVAIEHGYKLNNLNWGQLKAYNNYITDTNYISIDFLMVAVKNNILTLEQISIKIVNSQQKIDFIIAVSVMGEDLNKLEPKLFIGFSTNQIQICIKHGLKLKKLTYFT